MNWLVLYAVNLVLSQAPPPDFACDLPSMERQRCDRELIENSLLRYKIIGNASEFTTYYGERLPGDQDTDRARIVFLFLFKKAFCHKRI